MRALIIIIAAAPPPAGEVKRQPCRDGLIEPNRIGIIAGLTFCEARIFIPLRAAENCSPSGQCQKLSDDPELHSHHVEARF